MSAIFIAILALGALSFSLYPLFRENQWTYAANPGINPHLEDLYSAREATYSAIKDLESDHAQGKLSDVDYQSTRAKYENKAVAILQQLNLHETNVAIRAQRTERACPQCGLVFREGDKFCARCGAVLGVPKCANCGTAIHAEWKFCKKCGAPSGALQLAGAMGK